MKKLPKNNKVLNLVTATAIIILTFVIALGQPALAAEKETFNWKMQSVDPPDHLGAKKMQPDFIKNVKNMSDGRLNIKLFTAGQLTPTMEIIQSLKTGMIDIAYTSNVYYTGDIPEAALSLVSLPPLLLETYMDATRVLWYEGIDEILREAYAKKDIYYLGSIITMNPVTNWSKEKLKSVEDFEGHKIRSFGYLAKTYQKLGASPTFVPHEEVYTSLAQGVIDGTSTFGSYYEKGSYYEVAPYYYQPGVMPVNQMCMLVSMKSWKKLPEDIKQMLKTAFTAYTVDTAQRLWWEHEQMLDKLPEIGANLVEWSDDDLKKIREASLTFLPEISEINKNTKKGIQIYIDYMKKQGYLEEDWSLEKSSNN